MNPQSEDLRASVEAALAAVRHPSSGEDLLAGGQVEELQIDEDGRVTFDFVLRPEDPGSLVRSARTAVEAVPGVSRVKIDVKLPQAPRPSTRRGSAAGRHAHPPQGLRPGSVPAPTPDPNLLPEVRHILAVSSGKGGVGKSTVAANLAAALSAEGRRVGLLDADVYGPDIPLMFGETGRPQVVGAKGQEKILPLESKGVKLMSLGFLLEADQPAVMRGPLVSGVLRQFLEQVEWGPLDYLVVDMPPGTGDAQLSLVQITKVEGAIMVTTPQEVSTGDVRRGIRMFERVQTPVLGVVENMSGLSCPHCGGDIDVFGRGGGRALADSMQLPFLGEIPLDPEVRRAGDEGVPTAISAPDSPAGVAFRSLAEAILVRIEGPVVASR